MIEFFGIAKQYSKWYSCLPVDAPLYKVRHSSHPAYTLNLRMMKPLGDFIHFYNVLKPWVLQELPRWCNSVSSCEGSQAYWFYNLRHLNETLQMGIDFDHWKEYSALLQESPYKENRAPDVETLRHRGGEDLSVKGTQ